jgi:mRNA-decapping enzyme subunit 2
MQVLEETGYNLAGKIKPEDVIQMSIKEQKISLYIVPCVSEDFEFKTRTRKEISVRRLTNTTVVNPHMLLV